MSSQEGPVRSDSEGQTRGQSTPGLRRLLPAAASTAGPSRGLTSASPDYSIRPLRHQVPAACLQCRKRKVKCSGARPSCHRCLQNDVDCKWDTEPDTSRLVSIRKRKEELERENEDLHEFLRFLISRPEEEAFEIFKRLRASGDALEVLNFVRSADLLLQRRQVGDDVNQESPKETTAGREDDLPVSHFKVLAKPWTNLANDIIVSDLITSFFRWEAPFFLPFVDQQTFLDDMRGCSPETATYCSPLLVNAICALRSHTSERAETFGRANGCDLRMLFLNEAKQQLELERGEALLTTAQALFIMYLTTLALGMETSAAEYHLAACDVARTIQSEVKGILGAKGQDERATSKALWGMYCFESICAFSYLRPSALSKPPTFRHFFDEYTRHGAELRDEECRVTIIRNAMVLEATCDLSATFNDIMEYNCGMTEYQMNVDDDFRIRRQFATLLSQLRPQNDELRSEKDADLHGFYFRAYECQIALAILRPLEPETPFPADDTVADLLFAQCERSIEGIEDHDRAFAVKNGSPMILHFLFNIAVTLTGILRHLGSQNLFARTCRLIRDRTHYFPLAWQLLRGLWAIVMDGEDQIPEAAKSSFEGLLQLDESMSEDVPISFRVPSRRVSEGVRGHRRHGVRLSDLTSRMQSRKPAPGDGGGTA